MLNFKLNDIPHLSIERNDSTGVYSSEVADILEKLKQKGNVPIHLTEVTSSKALLSDVISSDANSKAPLSTLEEQKAQNLH